MKILQINSVYKSGSTGRIVKELSDFIDSKGERSFVIFGRKSGKANSLNVFNYSSMIGFSFHLFLTRIFDRHGFGSLIATKRIIRKIKQIDPDIIHIHNIHGYYLNFNLLIEFLKGFGKPIVWTLHDCWLFTGHCAYFSNVNCEKWITGCNKCPAKKYYPTSIGFDNSRSNYESKKLALSDLSDVVYVTPSTWLERQLNQSFLKTKPHKIIPNGINLNVFKPNKTNYFERHNITNKFIIIGVSNIWEERKGLDFFHKLSKKLDSNFFIFLVGLSKKQIKQLPPNIIGIERTENVNELVEIYSSADILLNSSTEETFGLVTLEAQACGTPVIVFNSTALPEVVNSNTGFVVRKNDLEQTIKAINYARSKPFNRTECRINAETYSDNKMYNEYFSLYKDLLG